MPEGPEVQTMTDQLKKEITERTVRGFSLHRDSGRILKKINALSFEKAIMKQKIVNVDRVGKGVLFKLSSGDAFLYYPSMTGRLLLTKNEIEEIPSFVRAEFELSDSVKLYISDKRKFSRLYFVSEKNLPNLFKKRPPDVVKGELSQEKLFDIVSNTKKDIHSLLLDQKKISGLGNIYANEILYEARVHPMWRANTLSTSEVERMSQASRKIIKEALKEQGTSFSDYLTPLGKKGQYQDHLKVFKRAGEKCTNCGCTIERYKKGGRSIFVCPGEQ